MSLYVHFLLDKGYLWWYNRDIMTHILYVLLVTMVLIGPNGHQRIDHKVISTHWSLSECKKATKDHVDRIGPNWPNNTHIGCLGVEHGMIW